VKVVTDDRERGASVDGPVLAVAKRNGIAVPTMRREAARCLRCDLEESEG